MKKLTSIILTLAISFSILSIPLEGAAAFVAPQVGDDIILNGGFEQISGNAPVGWSDSQGSFGTSEMRLENNTVHTGTYSMKLGGINRDLLQTFDAIPGATYTLSFWVYDDGDSAGVRPYYALSGNYGFEKHGTAMNAKGQWTQHVWDISIPYAITGAKIGFRRLGRVGYSYVDDVKLTIKSLPARYRLDRRDIINYSDAGTGEAYVYASPDLLEASEISNTTVEFSVMDGNLIAVPKKTVRFINNKATYKYDLSQLTEKKRYTLKAVIKYNGNTEELTAPIYKYPRPTSLSSDGVLIDENNKPFTPLMAYCPGKTYESFAKLPEAGFNTVHLQVHNLEITQQYLQWCKQLGLRAVIEFYYGEYNGHTFYPTDSYCIETTRQVVTALRNDPTVLAYATRDEPPIATAEQEQYLLDAYLLFRNIDDMHPVHIMQWDQAGLKNPFEVTAKYCDILGMDRYPGYTGDYPKEINTYTRKTIDSMGGRKPVWIAIQSTSLNGPDGDFPTCDNIRDHFYRALEEGAKGIAYYSVCEHGFPEYAYLYNKPVWNDLKTFGQNEAKLALDYFGIGKYETFKKVDEGSPGGFYVASFTEGDNIYLLAHNRNASSVTKSFELVSDDGKKTVGAYKAWKYVNGIPTDNVIYSDSSTFTVTLGGHEPAFYKITPLEASNFEGLSSGVKTGWAGASIQSDAMQASGSHELYLRNATVVNSSGQGAEGDDSYLKFETANSGDFNNSAVTFRSRVTPGNNYVVTFWTKAKALRTFAVSAEYEVFQGNNLMPWTTDALHESDTCYQTFSENNLAYMNSRLNASPGGVPISPNNGNTGYVEHEGLWQNVIGYDADDGWVKNELEFHIPHCADVLKLTIMANGRNANAFKGEVDNFSIRQVESNIICNGDFDYQSYFVVNNVNSATAYEGRLTPSNWQTKVGNSANAGASFTRTADNGNNYYIADSVTYSGAANGMQLDQYVTLHPGTYKLSFKRIYFEDREEASEIPQWGFVSMRVPTMYGTSYPKYSNEPTDDNNSLGASTVEMPPLYGCSLMPHAVGAGQTAEDGWVNYEVYFDVTETRRFTLSFGSKYADAGKWAIDDVVLLPVEDMELGVVKDGQVTSQEAEFTWTGQPAATTSITDVKSDCYSSVDDGGSFQAILSVKTGASSKSGVLVTAIYENLSNCLKSLYDVNTKEFTAPANDLSLVNTAPLTVPSGGDYTVKAFVWNSLSELKPLLEGVTLE